MCALSDAIGDTPLICHRGLEIPCTLEFVSQGERKVQKLKDCLNLHWVVKAREY